MFKSLTMFVILYAVLFAAHPAMAWQKAETDKKNKTVSSADAYNYILGTQAIGGSYQFTTSPPLVEAARAILEMGSNTLKFTLVPDKSDNLKLANLTETARNARSVQTVLAMPFANYLLWVYPVATESKRFLPESLQSEYVEMFDLTCYLLQTYAGTGKRFYLGNWEGDWHLTHTDPNYVPTAEEVQNMIAWVNMRQKAVDDARRKIPHRNVEVYYYLEVNRVVDATQGKVRLTNAVLPKTNVDYVSYSSYDALGGNISLSLPQALNYIEAQLPHKSGIPGKRVFIGEYGFAGVDRSPAEQESRSRQVMRAGLTWGCPFVLYWEMFNNEVTADGKQTGFWLIDAHNVKQPVYYTHQRFYQQAHQYVIQFQRSHHRLPTQNEYRAQAITLLDALPVSH